MDDAQVTGSTSSYARKYALNGMYNIDDTKDADTNEYRQQAQKKANNTVKEQATGFNPEETLKRAMSAVSSADLNTLTVLWNQYGSDLKAYPAHFESLKGACATRKKELTENN